MLDNEKVGQRIALLRKEKHLTGEKLAELLDVSPQAVSKWENGKCLPETALLPNLAKTLGCTIDALLVPKELLILEATYTDGMMSFDVTPAINALVRENKLDIHVAPQFAFASIYSDRLKLLTAKYRTPGGTYYAFAAQNDTLSIDLNPGSEIDSDFKIVGAYYGNASGFRPVMQKIAHYDYFKWDTIHVNHETFPSATASDATEYLALVYINNTGIHTISCAENDSLYFSADRKSLYLKDNSRRFLPGIMRLNWEVGMDCPWAGALFTALKYMGEDYTYEQLMGLSGACYRICFTEVWDWSCNDALVAYDYASILFKAIGYAPVWADRLEKDDRKAERQSIVSDIQNGKPVLAINLRIAPEWGLITGYLDDGNEFLCRTYFDKPVFDEHAGDREFLKDTGGYLSNDWWPFLILHFGEKVQAQTPHENLLSSLRALVDSFRAEPARGYLQGRQAYEAWIGGLSNEKLFTISGDREDVIRRLEVNDSMLLTLIDARRCAASYLTESAGLLKSDKREVLLRIAENCAKIADMLRTFRDGNRLVSPDAFTYNMIQAHGVSSPEARKEQAALLRLALALEDENVQLAETILLG